MNDSEIKVLVKESYGKIARTGGSCCPTKGSCCGTLPPEEIRGRDECGATGS